MGISDYKKLMVQKHHIENFYDCFECRINARANVLSCKGTLKPLEDIDPYDVIIKVYSCRSPRVFIINPVITIKPEIHIYKEGNLCLYYPSDLYWNSTTSVSEYTIPWINEWILYYELYKISGKWEGHEAPHGINK